MPRKYQKDFLLDINLEEIFRPIPRWRPASNYQKRMYEEDYLHEMDLAADTVRRAKRGNKHEQFNLGYLCEEGFPIRKAENLNSSHPILVDAWYQTDLREAFQWYCKAAIQGVPAAKDAAERIIAKLQEQGLITKLRAEELTTNLQEQIDKRKNEASAAEPLSATTTATPAALVDEFAQEPAKSPTRASPG